VVPVYDNHTHLDHPLPRSVAEAPEAPETLTPADQLDRASSVGVRGVVQVGTDLESSTWAADLASREPRVLAAVAIHPNDAPRLTDPDAAFAEIDRLAALPRVRAVGETGLDFFHTGEDGHAAQIRAFEAHIEIAKRHGIALQIHDRDAHAGVLAVLDRVGAPDRTVFHCFSGDAELARLVTDRGWYVSFAGTVTFKNAPGLRDALSAIPRSRILIETDAPFLTPMPHRGRPNSPYLIPWTLRAMADHLGTDASMLAAQIASNTEAVYGSWDSDLIATPEGPFADLA
jgi:TatD DNase family protein